MQRQDRPGVPWKGRIQTAGDGAFIHRFHACLDTCIGHFEGEMEMALVRDGRNWRLDADRAGVGTSGFEISARSEVDSDGLDIRAAES